METIKKRYSHRFDREFTVNAIWGRNVFVSYWKLAAFSEQNGSTDARDWWRKAYQTLSAMKQRGLMLPTFEQYLA